MNNESEFEIKTPRLNKLLRCPAVIFNNNGGNELFKMVYVVVHEYINMLEHIIVYLN